MRFDQRGWISAAEFLKNFWKWRGVLGVGASDFVLGVEEFGGLGLRIAA
jgi:hypothetical protein